VPLLHADEQLAWLMRKGDLHGFELVRSGGFLQLQIKNSHTKTGEKHNGRDDHSLTFFSVIFEGLLRVVNLQRFSETLECGIGPGKSFGLGLLSIIPLKHK
jgi:CRISPR system Cascade subunit CasE